MENLHGEFVRCIIKAHGFWHLQSPQGDLLLFQHHTHYTKSLLPLKWFLYCQLVH